MGGAGVAVYWDFWVKRQKRYFREADWQNEPDPPAWVIKTSDDIRHAKQKH
jgi:hypothetical protein